MVPRETSPSGPYLESLVIYLDFPLNNHMAKTYKQRRHKFFIHSRQSCWMNKSKVNYKCLEVHEKANMFFCYLNKEYKIIGKL